tara:strand:+ start:70 stop:327 length:258 start_codon:yes stop_codon:yes gene_type:complete
MSQEQGIDTLAKEMGKYKEELTELKDDMTNNMASLNNEDKHTISDFVDHYQSCEKDDCDIHNLKERESKTWFLKGIQIGKKLKSQ